MSIKMFEFCFCFSIQDQPLFMLPALIFSVTNVFLIIPLCNAIFKVVFGFGLGAADMTHVHSPVSHFFHCVSLLGIIGSFNLSAQLNQNQNQNRLQMNKFFHILVLNMYQYMVQYSLYKSIRETAKKHHQNLKCAI